MAVGCFGYYDYAEESELVRWWKWRGWVVAGHDYVFCGWGHGGERTFYKFQHAEDLFAF